MRSERLYVDVHPGPQGQRREERVELGCVGGLVERDVRPSAGHAPDPAESAAREQLASSLRLRLEQLAPPRLGHVGGSSTSILTRNSIAGEGSQAFLCSEIRPSQRKQ